MKNIPQSRIILYFLIAGMLPVLFAAFHFLTLTGEINDLRNYLELVEQQAFSREQKQAQNMAIRENYKEADHFYIDKNLETLDFLGPEEESLNVLVNNKYFAGDENVKKRLDLIGSEANSFLFTESNVQNYPYFQETTLSLVHPVEVNLSDLQHILALIEGESIGSYQPAPGRPQLIITDFKIDKKEVSPNNEVFQLNMKLLKREFQ